MAEPVQKNRLYFGTLVDRSNFSKEINCKWCDAHIITLGKHYKSTHERSTAFIAYFEHWKTCEKANAEMYGQVEKKAKEDSIGRGYSNCPCCGDAMRTDHLLRHIGTKHVYDCLLSTPIDIRKRIGKDMGIPIVYGNVAKPDSEDGYKTVLYVCAVCKKGALCCGHKNAYLDNPGKIKLAHASCAAEMEKFAAYYSDESPVEYLPFFAKSFSNKKAADETVGGTENKIILEEDPFKKAFVERALAVLKVSDVKKGIAELENLENLIKAIRKMNRDDDENDSFEDMTESIEDVEDKITKAAKTAKINCDQRIANLERQIAEKDAIISTFQTTLKWSRSGVDASDSDGY